MSLNKQRLSDLLDLIDILDRNAELQQGKSPLSVTVCQVKLMDLVAVTAMAKAVEDDAFPVKLGDYKHE